MREMTWQENLSYDLNYYYRRSLSPFRKFYRFVLKLWDYLPVLWQDEDWSHGYILILLHKKIQRTKNCIKQNANHLDWETDVAELQEAEDRLKYLIDFDDTKFEKTPVMDYMHKETVAYLETFEYIGQCIRRWWD